MHKSTYKVYIKYYLTSSVCSLKWYKCFTYDSSRC